MKMIKQLVLTGLVLGVSLVLGACTSGSGQSPQEMAKAMLLETPSPLGFEETLERIEKNAKAQGWKVPGKWKVNFQRNLKKVTGVDVGPNRVLKMCAPEPAAKLLQKDEYKVLTAMMPCTIAVYVKSDGKTYVSAMNLRMLGQLYGGDVAVMAEKLAPQMDAMLVFD